MHGKPEDTTVQSYLEMFQHPVDVIQHSAHGEKTPGSEQTIALQSALAP